MAHRERIPPTVPSPLPCLSRSLVALLLTVLGMLRVCTSAAACAGDSQPLDMPHGVMLDRFADPNRGNRELRRLGAMPLLPPASGSTYQLVEDDIVKWTTAFPCNLHDVEFCKDGSILAVGYETSLRGYSVRPPDDPRGASSVTICLVDSEGEILWRDVHPRGNMPGGFTDAPARPYVSALSMDCERDTTIAYVKSDAVDGGVVAWRYRKSTGDRLDESPVFPLDPDDETIILQTAHAVPETPFDVLLALVRASGERHYSARVAVVDRRTEAGHPPVRWVLDMPDARVPRRGTLSVRPRAFSVVLSETETRSFSFVQRAEADWELFKAPPPDPSPAPPPSDPPP